jgi:hypothetical protein
MAQFLAVLAMLDKAFSTTNRRSEFGDTIQRFNIRLLVRLRSVLFE